jgi:RNA polymerase sigma-70 factor (ECF subfamily)
MTPAGGDPRSDHQLIDACNQGDMQAFEALYRRHRDHVLRLACRFTGDRHAALDAMQETFVYLLGKFPGFELRAKMTTFLYPVVKHNVQAASRKRPRLAPSEAALEQAATVDPPAHDELAEALAGLSAEHREVILLRFVDDLSLKEIAQVLAIPLGTVKSRLHHAIGRLRADPGLKNFFSP